MVAIDPENTAVEEREQTRKRRRLTWDVAPATPENQGAEVRFLELGLGFWWRKREGNRSRTMESEVVRFLLCVG